MTEFLHRVFVYRPRSNPKIYQNDHQMMRPLPIDTSLLFANPDAQYWIVIPKTEVIRIDYKLPISQLYTPSSYPNHKSTNHHCQHYKYAAFMIGNAATTQTLHGWKCYDILQNNNNNNNIMNQQQPNKENQQQTYQTIFVTTSIEKAQSHGWTNNIPILLYSLKRHHNSTSNDNNNITDIVVIFRQIVIHKKKHHHERQQHPCACLTPPVLNVTHLHPSS